MTPTVPDPRAGMSDAERLDTVIDWYRTHMAALLQGCEAGDPYALAFNRALLAACQTPTETWIEAAEFALLELSVEWEGIGRG